jgi:hypothetical protein
MSLNGSGVNDFLTRGRGAVSCCVVLLAGLMVAPGCGNLALSTEAAPATGVDPGYIKIVATYMKTTFPSLSPYDAAEISEPRWVQTEKGWNWLACVHFQDNGRRRTYSAFFKNDAVVDARYAVLTDACGTQSYSPIDLWGPQRPNAIGINGPLY